MAKSNRAVRDSKTGRPIMRLLDVLGKRWTLRVLWELRDERLTFRELRERCDDVSPTSLNHRLIAHLFNLHRHSLSRRFFKVFRIRSFAIWDVITAL
jgi:hypothetical protein